MCADVVSVACALCGNAKAAMQRDTSLYPPLRSKDGRPRALRQLAQELGLDIQKGAHSPVEVG